MRNYDRINAPPPDRIIEKRAHIVGGGIGGMAAAAFLISDAHMPAKNVTVYESGGTTGGALDAPEDHSGGYYKNRGSRMFERYYECLSYLCEKIPSTQTPGLTVLDETYRANVENPIYCKFRLMERQGQRRPTTGAFMSPGDGEKMLELLLTPEDKLDGLTIGEWFKDPEFFDSMFWACWGSMFGFTPYHSLIECKRYLHRFAMYVRALPTLSFIIHAQYNDYDSFVKPLLAWLEGQGVRFRTGTHVRDIETENQGKATVATALVFDDAAGHHRTQLTRDDLVFFTNGSMTQNSTQGDNRTVAKFDRGTSDRGCFTVWEKLAARDLKFGRPAAFISDVDRSGFCSFTAAIKGDPTFFDYMEAKTGVAPLIRNCCTLAFDSNWKINFFLYGKKYYRDQPDDVDIVHAYGLFPRKPGNYIKTSMEQCTGAEMFSELLYHCGLRDKIDQILAHTKVTTTAMPYIVSEFMPRKIGDRPTVIPEGCVNLAFMGQFVEVPGDCVFTVETSVRTAMMAVWGLVGLDKPMIPLYEPVYDVRVLADIIKVSTQSDSLRLETLAQLKGAAPASLPQLLDGALSRIPKPEW